MSERNVEEKEQGKNGDETVRLPFWAKNEKESQWKDIEEYHAQYFNIGGSMLCDYGAFHAISGKQHFVGQSAAHGQTVS